jgi:transposase
LETIPGVGFITATAIAATVTDPMHFKSSRQFAAWLGLTPKQTSSGGKERLGGISKMGDRYLRTLLVVGATSVMRYARGKGAVSAVWINIGCACQQDGADRMGPPRQARKLPRPNDAHRCLIGPS